MAEKKSVVLGGVKGGLLAFVICTVAVLVTALFAKWFNLSQTTLNIVGQAVKVAAVFAAVLIAVRDGAYVPKALLVAVVFLHCKYRLLSYCRRKFRFRSRNAGPCDCCGSGSNCRAYQK